MEECGCSFPPHNQECIWSIAMLNLDTTIRVHLLSILHNQKLKALFLCHFRSVDADLSTAAMTKRAVSVNIKF